jgi:hypothetical protein
MCDCAWLVARFFQRAVLAGVLTPLLGIPIQAGYFVDQPTALRALNSVGRPAQDPLRFPNSALEPIDRDSLDDWGTDDHAAAFATFLTSCRPLLRTNPKGQLRPMYYTLKDAYQKALAAGQLAEEQARLFFERNFRPLHITKLGSAQDF